MWTLVAFGHPSVTILLGGLPRWESEGYGFECGPPPSVAAAPREDWVLSPTAVADCKQVRAISEASLPPSPTSALLLDARAANRFCGDAPEPRPGLESGHIPGSYNLPFPSLLDSTTRRGAELAPSPKLLAAFQAAGVDVGRPGPIVLTCGSGVTSCVLVVGLWALGRREGLAVYDGSFAEWGIPGKEKVAKGISAAAIAQASLQ